MAWLLPLLALLLLPYAPVAQHARTKRIALHPIETPATKPAMPVPAPIPKPAPSVPDAPATTVHKPLEAYRITSPFGWRRHPVTGRPDFHNGIDLAVRAGIVRSIMDGTVEATGYHRNLGKYVRIAHAGVQSIYGHLSHITVGAGQAVTAGYPIGITGTSGRTTGEHLHFSIRRDSTYIDPWKFLHSILQHIENEQ